jgi:prepilin-type N-terminal cleavage/methylation domain-containing protein
MLRSAGDKNGFSLIELAIVITLSGFIMVAGFSIYKSYFDSKNFHETYFKETVINDAIMTFYGMTKRYPCPADGSLSSIDPRYGVENCNDGPTPTPVALGNCNNADGGFCNVPGRDTGLDGTPGPDSVLTGVIPFRTIMVAIAASGVAGDLSFSSSIDRWGRFFSYAVTKRMTNNSTFDAAVGAISIVKEDNASLLAQPGTAHYVIISHGKNGAGGFVAETAGLKIPCSAGSSFEQNNCDDSDATFMSGLLSLGDGPAYYDDIISFQSWGVSSLWGIAANGLDIFNKNPGNVGIGTIPTEKLDITGSLSLSGNYNARSVQICDDAGGFCFPSSLLGGLTGIDCKNVASPSGTYRLLTGISSGAPVCSDPIPSPAIVTSQPGCTTGQFVSGVNMDGTFICSSF